RIWRNRRQPFQRLYQQLLRGKEISVRAQQREHILLSLSGLVTKRSGKWVVKNPIYRTIFTPSWFQQSLKRLPAVSPDANGMRWQSLSDGESPTAASNHATLTRRGLWATVAAVSLLTTATVLMFRTVGLLQSWELQAFDRLMQLRPPEAPDSRLLLIEVTEADVQAQPIDERGAASLSDETLERLLQKLLAAQPRTIGLDIYREQALEISDGQLAVWMQSSPHFFAICKYGDSGVPPPPGIALENHGFNNVLEDADGKIRRYPLAVSNAEPCANAYSLSWLLAADYLSAEDISFQVSQEGYLQLGEQIFKPLDQQAGGYQKIDARGHQIMINYRAVRQIADTMTLGAFLSGSIDEQRISDRLVLIGTSAPSFNDHRWQTPLHRSNQIDTLLNGVEVQAHLVSQLLSATLDQRPLIWTWPLAVDGLWIFAWSLAGSSLIVGIRTHRYGTIVVIVASGVLLICCWGLLLLGGWIPLVPSFICLFGSSVATRWSLVAIARTQNRHGREDGST
ncbi:MAG: CHASE2 domain-containing protein, partial [Cyanobacteria bacterium J06632_3]